MVSSVYRYVINIGQIEPAGLVKTMFAEHLLQLVALEGLEVLRQITNNSWVFVYSQVHGACFGIHTFTNHFDESFLEFVL